jgi:hypothetical protein
MYLDVLNSMKTLKNVCIYQETVGKVACFPLAVSLITMPVGILVRLMFRFRC